MRAVIYERYGGPEVLKLRDVPRPDATEGSVLVRVHAVSLNRSDWETLTARPAYVRVSGTGLRRPKRPILGSDIAGTVEAVGGGVERFQPGDEVLADTLYHGHGGLAEYARVATRAPLVHKPAGLSFADAAALPQGAVLALQGVSGVEAGQHLLIVGAGGGAGTFAVQLAKARGVQVTGVDRAGKLDLIRSLGADHAIDFAREDYTRAGRRYHRILDFVGARPLRAFRRVLLPGGTYQMVGGSVPRLIAGGVAGLMTSRVGSRRMGVLIGKPNDDDLARVAGHAADGDLRPVIDRMYELDEAPQALARLGTGEHLGKLVVTV